MPATPTYGLRYPVATDRPIGDEQFQALAEDIEDAATRLVPDTGSVTDTPVTAATGWQILVKEHRKIGKIVTLHVWARRTGAALTSAASGGSNPGNLAYTVVANMTDAALRPSFNMYNQYRASLTGGLSSFQPNGELAIDDSHSGSTIAKDTDEDSSTVQLYFVYPIP